MFRRFVAASAVGSVVIALGALTVLLLAPALAPERLYTLTAAWCFVPLAWGVWAMFAPPAWVPSRLPVWGAILGAMAGGMAALVLNLPLRVAGVSFAPGLRALGIIVGAVAYYLLWMLVRVAYQALAAGERDR